MSAAEEEARRQAYLVNQRQIAARRRALALALRAPRAPGEAVRAAWRPVSQFLAERRRGAESDGGGRH